MVSTLSKRECADVWTSSRQRAQKVSDHRWKGRFFKSSSRLFSLTADIDIPFIEGGMELDQFSECLVVSTILLNSWYNISAALALGLNSKDLDLIHVLLGSLTLTNVNSFLINDYSPFGFVFSMICVEMKGNLVMTCQGGANFTVVDLPEPFISLHSLSVDVWLQICSCEFILRVSVHKSITNVIVLFQQFFRAKSSAFTEAIRIIRIDSCPQAQTYHGDVSRKSKFIKDDLTSFCWHLSQSKGWSRQNGVSVWSFSQSRSEPSGITACTSAMER